MMTTCQEMYTPWRGKHFILYLLVSLNDIDAMCYIIPVMYVEWHRRHNLKHMFVLALALLWQSNLSLNHLFDCPTHHKQSSLIHEINVPMHRT